MRRYGPVFPEPLDIETFAATRAEPEAKALPDPGETVLAASLGSREEAMAALAVCQRLRPLLTRAIPWYSVQTLCEMAEAYCDVGEVNAARAALLERGIDTIVDMDASVDAGLPQAPGSVLYVYHPILDEDLPNLVKIEARNQADGLVAAAVEHAARLLTGELVGSAVGTLRRRAVGARGSPARPGRSPAPCADPRSSVPAAVDRCREAVDRLARGQGRVALRPVVHQDREDPLAAGRRGSDP